MSPVSDKLRGFGQGVGGIVGRSRQFLADVYGELRKSSWPTRGELVESTLVVIVSVVLFAAYVGASDFVLGNVIRLLMR